MGTRTPCRESITTDEAESHDSQWSLGSRYGSFQRHRSGICTGALSVELSGTGVQVLAAGPGVTKSDFARAAGSLDQEGGLPQLTPEHVARVAKEAADGGRVVRPIGAAYRVLAFLAAITPRSTMRRIMGRVFAPRQIAAGATRAPTVAHSHGKWRGGTL